MEYSLEPCENQPSGHINWDRAQGLKKCPNCETRIDCLNPNKYCQACHLVWVKIKKKLIEELHLIPYLFKKVEFYLFQPRIKSWKSNVRITFQGKTSYCTSYEE